MGTRECVWTLSHYYEYKIKALTVPPFEAWRELGPAGGPDRSQTRRILRLRGLRAWEERNSQRAWQMNASCI
eukprot:6714276-Prymnesium_polylepis.1